MHMVPAGYWKPYATSHSALDDDEAIQNEGANAARTLAEGVVAFRAGQFAQPGAGLPDPRQK